MSRILCKKCCNHWLKCLNSRNSRHFSVDLISYGNAIIKINKSIANSSIVSSTKEKLISLHELTSISWSLEIVLITTCVRSLVTFPLSIISQRILRRYYSLQPEINEFAERSLKDVRTLQYTYNWTPFKAKLFHNNIIKNETKRLIIRDNCHPMKASIVLWFQLPIWFILSHTLRNMVFMSTIDQNSQLVYKQLSNEGILWFSDLTQIDFYCILPILTALINLVIIEIHSNEKLKISPKTRLYSITTNFCRFVCLLLIPIGLQMPSAVTFYWFISSSVGLTQNLILRNKNIKQKLGIDFIKKKTLL